MSRSYLLASILIGLVTTTAHAVAKEELVFFGTRGAAKATLSDQKPGIYAASLDTPSGRLSLLGQVAQLDRAQWLAQYPHQAVLYAVATAVAGPDVNSEIHAYQINRTSGALMPINTVDAGGRDATHLSVDAASRTLFAANHGSDTGSPPPLVPGSVAAFPLKPDGAIEAPASVVEESGSGPNPRRQRNAQSHCVLLDPGGHFVLVADLGADRLFIYKFDRPSRQLHLAASATLPPGAGPRHMVFAPTGNFLYVNSELSAELHVFRWVAREGRLESIQSLSAYPSDYTGSAEKSSAELVMARDGRHLYMSLRGDQNSIVVYQVDGKSGMAQEIQRIPTGGQGSRSFAIDPTGRWLLAVNDNDLVTELAIDQASGRLQATPNTLQIQQPAAVLFYQP